MPQNNISSQIDSILVRRKEKAKALRVRKEQLQELERALIGVKQLSSKANVITDPDLQKQCKDLLKKVSIPNDVPKTLREIMRRMDDGIVRFERESLNVATVGRARQGKSTFLQAVGNLGNDIIPAFDAGDCTGAVSIIHNDPTLEPGAVRVDLTFRTKEELLDIVKGYVGNISQEYLQNNPMEYEDIAYIDVEELSDAIEDGDAGRTIQLSHLRRIVEDFNGTSDSRSVSVRNLCGKGSMSLTNPDEIRKYVAQNNGVSVDNPLRENYYSYLAVKRAEIYCRFREDVGKLVLVDTIGLGDTQYGIEGAMLETVDKQCDAAIVVTKPDSGIKDQDQKLYDLLRNYFSKRDTRKWLFYLANEQPGYNSNAIDTFVNNVRDRNFAVAGCMKINCKKEDQVQNGFLIPMLNTLIANMEAIDGAYLGEINDLCAKLHARLLEVIANFPEPANMNAETVVNMEVQKLGVKCYQEMAKSLAKQVDYWYQNCNKPNATLWNRVKDILNNLESILPSSEALQEVLDEAGSIMGFQLWEIPLNYVRNEITDQFITIDDLMEEENRNFKNALVRNLYDSLKNLSGKVRNEETDGESDEDIDMAAWLWEVMEPLLRDKPEYSQIYNGMQFLNQFEFNVRAQLILEVRNQLRIINPMTVEYYMLPNYPFHKRDAGQAVHFYLTSRLAILEDGLRYSLAKLNKMPNQAFYAAAEEFYDRMTFASDFENGTFVDMSQIWGQFFTQYSQLLWAAEVDRHKVVQEVMNEYTQYCDMLNAKLATLV